MIKKCNLVSSEEGYITTLTLLAEKEIPDAIFAQRIQLQLGLLKLLKKRD